MVGNCRWQLQKPVATDYLQSLKWNVLSMFDTGGGNAEFAAAHQDHMLPVAAHMSFTQAAAIPEVWLTAYQLIHLVGMFYGDLNMYNFHYCLSEA